MVRVMKSGVLCVKIIVRLTSSHALLTDTLMLNSGYTVATTRQLLGDWFRVR